MQRAIGALLGFVVTVVLSRALGAQGLGTYAFVVTLLALLSVPISNGWGTTLLKAAAGGKFRGDWAESRGLAIRGVQLTLALTTILSLVAFVIKAVIPGEALGLGLSTAAIVCIGCIFFFDQISALRASILRGIDRPVVAQMPEMLTRPTVLIAIFLAAAWINQGQVTVLHALYALIVAAFVSAIVGQLFVRWMIPGEFFATLPRFETRSWLAVSAPIALSAGLLSLNAHVGTLALGLLVDVRDVGLFRVAVQVSLVSGLAYTALNLIASQRFAYLLASDDKISMQIAATTMARIAAIFALPVLLLLVFAGEQFVPLVFGPEFGPALAPMVILAIGQFITAATGMAQPLLVMHGLERVVAGRTMLAVGINIMLCLILVPPYKGVGAALATVVAASFWKIALWKVARDRVRIETSALGFALR